MAIQAGVEAADMAGKRYSPQKPQLTIPNIDHIERYEVLLTNLPRKAMLQ